MRTSSSVGEAWFGPDYRSSPLTTFLESPLLTVCHIISSLGIDDLYDVEVKVLPVAARWRDIGLAPGISDSKLYRNN